jgi:DNA-binding NarL/FixJ family response regulator
MIRVLVVDDHPVVRSGLAGMLALEDDLAVAGEAGDGQAALDWLARSTADVILMDLRMPVMDGAAATVQIRARHPHTHVLVLTTYDADADILRAIEAGATGYLLKDTPREELIAGVRRAACGRSVLSPDVAGRLVRHTGRGPQPRPTAREIEVLAGVARGLTNAEIGRELFIGEATVKTYLLRVFDKLGVDDRTHAVTVAMERGLLPRPGE